MALLFIIVAAILIACVMKGAAKLAFKLIPVMFIVGIIVAGISHKSASTAPTQPNTAAPVQAITTVVETPVATPAPIVTQVVQTTVEPPAGLETASGDEISHAEPGSATQWNEEDLKPSKPSKKHGKTTRKAKAEPEPDATPTIREHVDEILDAPSPKAAVRAYADWMDELNEQMEAEEEEAEAEYQEEMKEIEKLREWE
jgi:hypothetical protein